MGWLFFPSPRRYFHLHKPSNTLEALIMDQLNTLTWFCLTNMFELPVTLSTVMEKVRIPSKVFLDAIMQQLGLPNAVYSTHKSRTIGLDATIQFYPTKQWTSKEIYVYGKLKDAEDWLANQALKYMKASYNKVLQDKNYDKLELVEQK